MRKLAGILALTLAVAGSAEAAGRAGCRAEFGLAPRFSCYAEQVLWGVGPLEMVGGLDVRYPGGITPYTAVALYMPDWWAAIEIGANLDGQFRLAVSGGVRW